MGLVLLESEMTISSAMNQGTQLLKLSKANKGAAMKIISGLIMRQRDLFNLRNTLTDVQVAILSNDLLEVFAYETLEDAVMMLKLARQGKLGEIYQRLDSETIFQKWVPAYLELKAEQREKEHQEKKAWKNTDADPEGLVKMDRLIKKLESNKKEKKENSINHRNFNSNIRLYGHKWSIELLEVKLNFAKEQENEEAVLLLKNIIKAKLDSEILNQKEKNDIK